MKLAPVITSWKKCTMLHLLYMWGFIDINTRGIVFYNTTSLERGLPSKLIHNFVVLKGQFLLTLSQVAKKMSYHPVIHNFVVYHTYVTKTDSRCRVCNRCGISSITHLHVVAISRIKLDVRSHPKFSG